MGPDPTATERVVAALEAAGLFTQDIGSGVINVYDTDPSVPVADANAPDGYVGTVTVTVTP